jgi:hypothetical protein
MLHLQVLMLLLLLLLLLLLQQVLMRVAAMPAGLRRRCDAQVHLKSHHIQLPSNCPTKKSSCVRALLTALLVEAMYTLHPMHAAHRLQLLK